MKEPQSKATAVTAGYKKNATERCLEANKSLSKQANDDFARSIRMDRYARIGAKPMHCKLPTVVQLAQLSATLARGFEK